MGVILKLIEYRNGDTMFRKDRRKKADKKNKKVSKDGMRRVQGGWGFNFDAADNANPLNNHIDSNKLGGL